MTPGLGLAFLAHTEHINIKMLSEVCGRRSGAKGHRVTDQYSKLPSPALPFLDFLLELRERLGLWADLQLLHSCGNTESQPQKQHRFAYSVPVPRGLG